MSPALLGRQLNDDLSVDSRTKGTNDCGKICRFVTPGFPQLITKKHSEYSALAALVTPGEMCLSKLWGESHEMGGT